MLHEKLDCYRRAVRLAEELSKEGARWPKGLGYLIDQKKRAMASVVLNLAEGNARKSNKERRRFFEISRASVIEAAACVDLALAFGLMGKERALGLKLRLTEISKMIWGLMR
jgi:four helix bundle protein